MVADRGKFKDMSGTSFLVSPIDDDLRMLVQIKKTDKASAFTENPAKKRAMGLPEVNHGHVNVRWVCGPLVRTWVRMKMPAELHTKPLDILLGAKHRHGVRLHAHPRTVTL